MKPGSLVATNYSTEVFVIDAAKGGYKFISKPPSPNEIYVCKALYPFPFNPNYMVIELEEIKLVSIEPKNGSYDAWLFAAYWFEVQPPHGSYRTFGRNETI